LEESYHKCGVLLNRLLKNSIRVPSVAEMEIILGKHQDGATLPPCNVFITLLACPLATCEHLWSLTSHSANGVD
jgi:hypothetical protein